MTKFPLSFFFPCLLLLSYGCSNGYFPRKNTAHLGLSADVFANRRACQAAASLEEGLAQASHFCRSPHTDSAIRYEVRPEISLEQAAIALSEALDSICIQEQADEHLLLLHCRDNEYENENEIETIELAPLSARLAIVLDDVGFYRLPIRTLLNTKLSITYAFMPFTPWRDVLLREVSKEQQEIWLHLPLEPHDPSQMDDDGFLTTQMSRDEMRAALLRDLQQVPLARGVNNHMGSHFSTEPQAMGWLLTELARQKLLYVDSRTTALSVGYTLAKAAHMPALQRDVFLDNLRDPAQIERQLVHACAIAEQRGFAVAIGHPYPETVAVLQNFSGHCPQVELVAASLLAGFEPLDLLPSAPDGFATQESPY